MSKVRLTEMINVRVTKGENLLKRTRDAFYSTKALVVVRELIKNHQKRIRENV